MRHAQPVDVRELEGGTRLDRRRAAHLPEWPGKPISLSEDERRLLCEWADGSASVRKWDRLRELAGIARLELADRLIAKLLQLGVCVLREKFQKAVWRGVEVSWIDLASLQRELGLATAADKFAEKAEIEAHLKALFADELVGEVAGQLHAAVLALSAKRARAELLAGLSSWVRAQATGLRQDFALHARPHTKAVKATEWAWLEACFDLAGLGIGRFMPMLSIAGCSRLRWPDAEMGLRAVPFLALPCDSVAGIAAVSNPPSYYWLIENRACFEKQAVQRPQGCCLIWTAGRPNNSWLRAMQALLLRAPAPAWISADADPAGIEIALAAAGPWRACGLPWEPRYMDEELLRDAKRQPLNSYDTQCLQRLRADDHLPASLRELADALHVLQGKAEQESWL
jgi:hypothetical protein